MTADGGQEKRRIGWMHRVAIVFIAAVASVLISGGAAMVWAYCVPLLIHGAAPTFYGINVHTLCNAGFLGAMMAGAAIFIWRQPGLSGGLRSASYVVVSPFFGLGNIKWTAFAYGLTPNIIPFAWSSAFLHNILYGVAVWTIPLLCSVLPWRQGVSMGALILAVCMGFLTWTSWTALESTVADDLRTLFVGTEFLYGTLPVLVGFVSAGLMLPRERPQFVSVTTVPLPFYEGTLHGKSPNNG